MGKDVFENAIVDTNILIVRHSPSDATGKAVDMDRLSDKSFPPAEPLWGDLRPQGEKPWSALSAIEQRIMDKMEAVGTPLKEWDIAIYRGVLTGYNDAFVIDNDTKEALIAEDSRSADIIKPVLRGRDIQRYRAEWTKLWLIATFPALALNIDDYPAVRRHLLSFGKTRLEQSGRILPNGTKSRKKTVHAWYELQDTCAYHEVFSEEKLIWMDLTEQGRFSYDTDGMFCLNTAFVMSGQSVKYLCTLLNSKLITWFMSNTALNSGMGVTRWINASVSTIPIPKIPAAQQRPFIRLVDRILTAKATDPNADVSAIEAEIDLQVCELYELMAAEAAAVKKKSLP